TFTNVTADRTISVTFIPKPIPTFVVEASVSIYGGYATVTPKEQTVQSGNPAKITINPDAGSHITGVTDNGNIVPMTKLTENANGTYTYTVLAVYENHKIIVTLERNEYTIKAKAGEGGTISPSGTVTVKYNETETFTITPNSGYRIDKIIVDNKPIASTEQVYKFKNVKDNHTIEVTFARLSVKTPLIITLQIDNPEITINGIPKTIDEQNSKPIIKNDRTLIPIRALIESLNGNITWNEDTREVTINLNYHTIILTIDNNTAIVDGIKIQIDPNNSKVTPTIINGRTYLPLRFIVEHLDGVVDWDNDTRTVTIYYWP
ncbi:MAG: copper amine oxidase N-terminal domain-containing protein, partial [Caldisericota bacterium]|nr:copper amine oxidase N-terminal domain-containing protein [Caldisericota bacterium]